MPILLRTLLVEAVQLVGMTISMLLVRWLLELSTPEKDLAWLDRQNWYRQLRRLRFYRGLEYLHLLRAQRLLIATWSDAFPALIRALEQEK